MYSIIQKLLNRSSREESHLFSKSESKNVLLYIIGIMGYKFALETYLGSISITAADRFPKENAFALLGALQGTNQACQCIGSLLISPLVTKYPTNKVLSAAIFFLSLMAITLVVLEASTGGTLSTKGDWNIMIIFPIFLFTGVAHGMVELIRRIIPQAICGGDEIKLRKMDSLVHAFYEVAGTSGAFFSVFLLLRMGSILANVYVPIVWIFSGVIWGFITIEKNTVAKKLNDDRWNLKNEEEIKGFWANLKEIFVGFFLSIYRGFVIIFSKRRFLWLVGGYSIPLVLHRYLESQLIPAFSKNVLKTTSYAQIMVGGSNFGELFGAVIVFLFTYSVHTPLPWVRWDALTLNLLWLFPYTYFSDPLAHAWFMSFICFFISSGWAAGDVSLAAFIQASLSHSESEHHISPLSAVMAFLYTLYIVVYALLSFGLGKVVDYYVKQNDNEGFLFWISGVMMSIAFVVIFISTFIPKGSCKLNPDMEDLGIKTKENSEEEVEQQNYAPYN